MIDASRATIFPTVKWLTLSLSLALRAALNPAPTDYLYFVANDQGGHFFSKTLAEHNRNVARYRQLLRGDAAADPAPKNPGHRGGM